MGLTLALAGIMAVGLDRALLFGNLYPVVALATAIGVMALTSSLWAGRMISGWVPLAFALSMLLGIVGATVTEANSLFVWSGVVFGVAFAGLGCMIWSSSHTATPGHDHPHKNDDLTGCPFLAIAMQQEHANGSTKRRSKVDGFHALPGNVRHLDAPHILSEHLSSPIS